MTEPGHASGPAAGWKSLIARTGPQYLLVLLATLVVTALCALLSPRLPSADLVMVFLIELVVVSTVVEVGPSAVAAVLNAVVFDFFFVVPRFSFVPSDLKHLVTVGGMLTVGLAVSILMGRLRRQREIARMHERQTAALLALGRDLARTQEAEALARVVAEHGERLLNADVAVFLEDEGTFPGPSADAGQPNEEGTYRRPLAVDESALGVIRVRPRPAGALLTPSQDELLGAIADLTSLAVRRSLLAEEAKDAQVQVESERLRNALLSSVSHDLRTPLATITGAADSLLEGSVPLDGPLGRELLDIIFSEGNRLNRLVSNLLQMTRLTAGALEVHREWNSIEEMIGDTLARLGKRLEGRSVCVRIAPETGLILVDGVLIEQAVFNLVDNAICHTPPGTPIEIRAERTDADVLLIVEDEGLGLPDGEEVRVFECFYRAPGSPRGKGVGLGLAVCKGIAEAHGGTVRVMGRPGGGAAFCMTLPILGAQPVIPLLDDAEEMATE